MDEKQKETNIVLNDDYKEHEKIPKLILVDAKDILQKIYEYSIERYDYNLKDEKDTLTFNLDSYSKDIQRYKIHQ